MASIGGWRLLAEPHDRALAELFLDLADRELDGPEAFLVLGGGAGLPRSIRSTRSTRSIRSTGDMRFAP